MRSEGSPVDPASNRRALGAVARHAALRLEQDQYLGGLVGLFREPKSSAPTDRVVENSQQAGVDEQNRGRRRTQVDRIAAIGPSLRNALVADYPAAEGVLRSQVGFTDTGPLDSGVPESAVMPLRAFLADPPKLGFPLYVGTALVGQPSDVRSRLQPQHPSRQMLPWPPVVLMWPTLGTGLLAAAEEAADAECERLRMAGFGDCCGVVITIAENARCPWTAPLSRLGLDEFLVSGDMVTTSATLGADGRVRVRCKQRRTLEMAFAAVFAGPVSAAGHDVRPGLTAPPIGQGPPLRDNVTRRPASHWKRRRRPPEPPHIPGR